MALNRRMTEKFYDDAFEPLLGAETARAAELCGKGVIRPIWSREDEKGVGVVLEVDELQEARRIMQTMLLAEAGTSEVLNIVPLSPHFGFAESQTTEAFMDVGR